MRKRNQGITIQHPDGNVHIVVVEIRGDKVRIGIEADKKVFIHRDELLKAIEASAAGDGEPLHTLEDRLDHSENQDHATTDN
jgi:carbon storage regulator